MMATQTFQVDPDFVSLLKQQPGNSSALDAQLENLRSEFQQQQQAIGEGSLDIGNAIRSVLNQTDALLAQLQESNGQWRTQLVAGMNALVACFSSFCQAIDNQSESLQAQWQASINTAQSFNQELNTLSQQMADTYLRLSDQQRQLTTLLQTLSQELALSQNQIEQTQQDIEAQQRKIDKVKQDESIASIFVGSAIAHSLGDLFTGMEGMQNSLHQFQQQAQSQQRLAHMVRSYVTSLSQLTTNLQTFTQHDVDVTNQWTALASNMDNFKEALSDRIHTDSFFFKAQVKSAGDDLNSVLHLFASI